MVARNPSTPTVGRAPLAIVELKASNVKRLTACHIRPDGALVVLGGKNGAGKSSVLDAITYALAGERSLPIQPIHRGADKAEVVLDLGEYVVRRSFTASGSTLTVTSKDGARYPTPQALLDGLTGKIAFDPLAFLRADAASQAVQLRGIAGLDFREIDKEREQAYADRTAVNRDGKAMKARFDAAPFHPGAPEAEQSADAILEERGLVEERNAAKAAQRQKANDAARDAKAAEDAIEPAAKSVADAQGVVWGTEREIARLQKLLAEQKAEVVRREEAVAAKRALATTARESANRLGAEAAALVDEDLAPFAARLRDLEAVNRRVRDNAARATLERDLELKRAESQRLSDQIAALDKRKADLIAGAPMPVEGLGFDAASGAVTFNGLPFDQASQAERIRVSVAMGLALNPRLRVLLIRDASLLDEDNLEVVRQMAEQAGAQVWLERVGRDEATTVMVEDGHATAGVEAGEAVAS